MKATFKEFKATQKLFNQNTPEAKAFLKEQEDYYKTPKICIRVSLSESSKKEKK